MRIGELAERAGCTVKAVRHYEDIGLLDAPVRTSSGYRSYDEAALHRLRFIKAGKEIGLTLAEIGGIVDSGRRCGCCEPVLDLLGTRIAEIDATIEELMRQRDRLRAVLHAGRQVDPTECTPEVVCRVIPSDHPGRDAVRIPLQPIGRPERPSVRASA